MKNQTGLARECICEGCPSWKKCGKNEIGFCLASVGKSRCIDQEKGCLCGGCPVYVKSKFKHGYYCTRDSENKQEKK